jgi:hypothetical protein
VVLNIVAHAAAPGANACLLNLPGHGHECHMALPARDI